MFFTTTKFFKFEKTKYRKVKSWEFTTFKRKLKTNINKVIFEMKPGELKFYIFPSYILSF